MNVHFLDMEIMEKANTELYHDFSKYGLFVISQPKSSFSAMRLNDRYEKTSKALKSDGGSFVIT